MDILMLLAFVAVIILLFISFQISRIIGLQREVIKSVGVVAICCDNIQKAVENASEDSLKSDSEINRHLHEMSSSISDIKFTTDIFEKYRLPDADERRSLDTIRAECSR